MSPLKDQFRSTMGSIVRLYIVALAMLGLLVVWGLLASADLAKLTRDPAAISGISPFAGVLSNIGILMWCAAAAICFFSAVMLNYHMVKDEGFAFLLSLGAVTTLLLLDDLFLLHEEVFPQYLSIDDKVVLPIYALILLAFLVKYRYVILQTRFLLLLFAFGFFGLSVVADGLLHDLTALNLLLEDGLKFFGIVGWLGYCAHVCFRFVDAKLFQQSGGLPEMR